MGGELRRIIWRSIWGKLYLNNAYDISNIAVDSLTKTLPVVGGVLGKVNIPSEGDELYANKVYCESKLTVSGTEYFQMYESASGRNEDINQSIGGDKSHIVLKTLDILNMIYSTSR